MEAFDPMKPTTLTLRGVPEPIGKSLSAMVPVGHSLWLGADEGTSLGRAEAGPANDEWTYAGTTDLVAALDLPGTTPDDDGNLPEVDAEGMDFDGQHLWVVGSHSLKRKQPKQGKEDAENWKRLEKVEADGNRYLLGRLPMDNTGRLIQPGTATAAQCAARLTCDLFGSELLDELRKDKLVARYLPAGGEQSKDHNLPGKDNGLDIEGLAAVGRDHLLIGLRGPVFRGFALVLELQLSCDEPPGDGQPARLRLKEIGPRKFRRLAFQLGEFRDAGDPGKAAAKGGLGIRDLCFDENGDLLILAGPTMVLPWPVTVFRWPGARAELATGTEDRFIWGTDLQKVLEHTPGSVNDRAESLCVVGSGPERRLVIGYDNEGRWSESGGLTVEAFPTK